MSTYDQLIRQAEDRARVGEKIQAMKLYAEAAKTAPQRKEPLVELALLFGDEGDALGAIGFLEKALALDPRDAFVRLTLGLAYYEQNRSEEAVRQLRAAVLIIQYFVSGARIDAMFVDGEEMEARLKQAEELEGTGEQAIELLQRIASEDVARVGQPVATGTEEEMQRLAS